MSVNDRIAQQIEYDTQKGAQNALVPATVNGTDAATPTAAIAAIIAELPGYTVSGQFLGLRNIRLTEGSEGGDRYYEAELSYERPENEDKPPSQEENDTFRCAISTTQETAFEAFSQSRHSPGGGDTAPKHGNRINVVKTDENLEVNGVSRIFPVMTWTEQRLIRVNKITPEYLRACRDAVGTTNSAAVGFAQWAEDEALLTGVSVDGESPVQNFAGEQCYRMVFTWAVGKHEQNLVIGEAPNQITVPEVKAHEYLWFSYRTEEDDGAPKNIVKVLQGAYVAQVYQQSDHAPLLLGSIPT